MHSACTVEGSIQLFDPTGLDEVPHGQLVICTDGALREVCSYGTFGQAAATVVCRELNFEAEGINCLLSQ